MAPLTSCEEELQRLSLEYDDLVTQAQSIHDELTEETNKLCKMESHDLSPVSKFKRLQVEESITRIHAELKLATRLIDDQKLKYEDTEKELGRLHHALKEKQQEELLQKHHAQGQLQKDLEKANVLTQEARNRLGVAAEQLTLFTVSIEQREQKFEFLQVPPGKHYDFE